MQCDDYLRKQGNLSSQEKEFVHNLNVTVNVMMDDARVCIWVCDNLVRLVLNREASIFVILRSLIILPAMRQII